MGVALPGGFRTPCGTAWRKRGYTLDLGIGIAQGYATLGAIGFAGRQDYAAIGSVTNLATRLCAEAKGGEILTNQKTFARIEDECRRRGTSGARPLEGFVQPVKCSGILSRKSRSVSTKDARAIGPARFVQPPGSVRRAGTFCNG